MNITQPGAKGKPPGGMAFFTFLGTVFLLFLLSVFLDTSSGILRAVRTKKRRRHCGSDASQVQDMNKRSCRDLGKRIVEAVGVVLVLLTVSAAESIANFVLM